MRNQLPLVILFLASSTIAAVPLDESIRDSHKEANLTESDLVNIYGSEIDGIREDNTTINIRWLNDITMQIFWANGQNDLIFLSPKQSLIGSTKDGCTFSGKFRFDLSGEATVVGCQRSEETIVSIGTSNVVKQFILKGGSTKEVVQNTLNQRTTRSADYSYYTAAGEGTNDYFDFDYEEDMNGIDSLDTGEDPPVLAASISGPPPDEITITISLGYDTSLLNFKDGSSEDTVNFINQAIELARPHFRHSSLSSKINLRVVPTVQKVNFATKAQWLCDGKNDDLENLMDSRKGNDIPLIIFAEDCANGQKSVRTGCAFTGAGCGTTNGRNLGVIDLSFCKKSSWLLVQTTNTLVHEIGHLLGMQHDFAPHHLERGCNAKGFMSYGTNLPEKWSVCSDSDFVAWFNNKGYTCPTIDFGKRSCGATEKASCSSCGSGPDTCNGECIWDYNGSQCIFKETGFTIREGYGWHNAEDRIENLQIVKDIYSVESCEESCSNTVNCVGFTYIPSASRCDLKADQMAVFFDQEDGIISGTLKLRPGTGWHNSDNSISTIAVATAEIASQCETPCRNTPGCVGWTYIIGKKRCDLKSADDAVYYNFGYNDVVSGLI